MPALEDPQHPYTRALLDAIPTPDPKRRSREKRLPTGEVPDALHPPAGCRFHPRCPDAFGPCGWQGRDLVDFLETRWGDVDTEVFEAELDATGPLDRIEAREYEVRFAGGDPAALVPLLRRLRDDGAGRVFSAVTDVATDDGTVVVRLGEGVEPALQQVDHSRVACHLHGVVPRSR